MIKADKNIKGSKVAILGVTFKENTPDVRNTKVVDVIKELEEYGVEVMIVDPVADKEDLWNEYGLEINKIEDVRDIDAIIFAVPHKEFKEINLIDIRDMFKSNIKAENNLTISEREIEKENCILVDIKGIFERSELEKAGFEYW